MRLILFFALTIYSTAYAQTTDYGPNTVKSLNGLQELQAFGGPSGNEKEVKYILYNPQSATGELLFLDPSFYNFHDEWYLFRLFTGLTIPGLNDPALGKLTVTTPAELQTVLRERPTLPAGLERVAGRVISNRFYSLSAGDRRLFGLGSVIYSQNYKRPIPQILAFTMVFNDSPNEKQVTDYLQRLTQALHLAKGELKWLPRSQPQEKLADLLRQKPEWKDLIVRAQDFIAPGETKVYSSGGNAGRLKYFAKGKFDPAAIEPEDIVLLEELPDDLPPVRGILTSVPQSPLSHVNLLARGRGTLNAHIADRKMFEDLVAKSASRQPVAILTEDTVGILTVLDLNQEDYSKFQEFFAIHKVALPAVDYAKMDLVYDLTAMKALDRETILRSVGGKAFGMTRLLNTQKIPLPLHPVAISTRAYHEHLAKAVEPLLRQALTDARLNNNARLRYLMLEGAETYNETFSENPTAEMQRMIDGSDASALGQLVKNGGVKEMIEKQPLNPGVEDAVLAMLKRVYPKVPQGQTIRFRSSSDVEDIPGFVGAGLHESFTGYIDPSTQARIYPDNPKKTKKEKQKTAAKAFKRTWASYWNYRAFAERELAGIDHLSGSMGVMIHPGFPENVERANGVLTVKRTSYPFMGTTYEVAINANPGEKSIVRPDGSVEEPQRMKILGYEKTEPYVQEDHPTTSGVRVLNKAQAFQLVKYASQVVERWMSLENANLKPEVQYREYTLDMEFKVVPADWIKNLSPTGADTLLLKQARPLMRLNHVPKELANLQAPRDYLNEGIRILKRVLDNSTLTFDTIEIYKKDTPHDGAFNVEMNFQFKKDIGRFRAGDRVHLNHTEIADSNHGFMHHGPWDLTFSVTPEVAAQKGIVGFQAYEGGGMTVDLNPEGQIQERGPKVEVTDLLLSPEQWVRNYARSKAPPPDPGVISIH